jgi:hypothetical protein
MDWAGSAAVAALRQAQAVSAYARRTGCGIDEAAGALANSGRAGPAPDDLARTGGGRPGDRAGVSRRAVLGGAGAVALAAALPTGMVRPLRAPASTDPRVVIIGSGLAGLGCAFRLWARQGLLRLVSRGPAHRRRVLLSQGRPVHRLQRDPGPAPRRPALRRGAHLGELPGIHGGRAAHRLPVRRRDHRRVSPAATPARRPAPSEASEAERNDSGRRYCCEDRVRRWRTSSFSVAVIRRGRWAVSRAGACSSR